MCITCFQNSDVFKVKGKALLEILKKEKDVLGDSIRSVVICDYEKTSAVTSEISHLLDEEAGGPLQLLESF